MAAGGGWRSPVGCDVSNVRSIVRYYPRAARGDGGMTGAVARWAAATTECGVPTTIVHDGGRPPEMPNVRWIDLPHRGPAGFRVPVGLGSVLADAGLLVLHSGWTSHGLVAGRVARGMGIPYVLEPRGAYDPHIVTRRAWLKRMWWLAAERRLVEGAAAIHVFYDDERDHLRRLGYRGAVIVVPNGSVIAGPPRWRGGDGTLLFLGRFDVEHKGIDLLVRAVASLPPADRRPVRLHGPDRRGGGGRAAVADLIRRHDLGRWIEIGPSLRGEAKLDALLACDAFVYPSRWDACPNAVLESVGLGVPTLATPYPLARDLAAHDALLLADASAGGLAAAIRSLPDHRSRVAMGHRGASVIADRYAWSRVARRWLDELEAAVGSDAPGAARTMTAAARH